ncbi:MAG TPA: outer membrane beta-barrel protein [Gemmatimonadaceae bacterium]|nr:outer membrane beta-barrel protein [Gemmatimonadaceae bacterium]
MLAGLALAAPAKDMSAQDVNPFEIGGAIGAAVPVGDLGDVTDLGYNATFMLGYNPVFLPVGLRFDAAYNEFGISDTDGNVNIPSFTANAIFKLPTGGFTPYVVGGAGLYRVSAQLFGATESENRFGWNIGGGISMPLSGFKVFVEARYNNVSGEGGSTDLSFVPIVFGASF